MTNKCANYERDLQDYIAEEEVLRLFDNMRSSDDIIGERYTINILSNELKRKGFDNWMEFPTVVPYSFYENKYDQIKQEYLVDHMQMNHGRDGNMYVFNPEFRTLAKEYSATRTKFNEKFIFVQKILSYDSPERINMINDTILGIFIANIDDFQIQKNHLQNSMFSALTEPKMLNIKNISHSSNTTNSSNFYVENQLVGSGEYDIKNKFCYLQINITDLFNLINKK